MPTSGRGLHEGLASKYPESTGIVKAEKLDVRISSSIRPNIVQKRCIEFHHSPVTSVYMPNQIELVGPWQELSKNN